MKGTVRTIVLSVLSAVALVLVGTAQADARPGAPTLSVGSTGHGVWCVQRILNRVYHWGLAEDAVYGAQTKDAVTTFQVRKGIAHDGIVGPVTGSYLIDAVQGDAYCYQYLPTVN